MYCTKCGKELNPNDRFCANCGAEVKPGQGDRKYDNVVFNPPFRMEAEKKTAQILKNREEFKGFKELAEPNKTIFFMGLPAFNRRGWCLSGGRSRTHAGFS